MFSTNKKLEYMYVYLMRRSDELLMDYQRQYQNQTGRPLDEIDYLELIISKSRFDLFSELERDIINIIGEGYYPKLSQVPTSQKKYFTKLRGLENSKVGINS